MSQNNENSQKELLEVINGGLPMVGVNFFKYVIKHLLFIFEYE